MSTTVAAPASGCTSQAWSSQISKIQRENYAQEVKRRSPGKPSRYCAVKPSTSKARGTAGKPRPRRRLKVRLEKRGAGTDYRMAADLVHCCRTTPTLPQSGQLRVGSMAGARRATASTGTSPVVGPSGASMLGHLDRCLLVCLNTQ